MKTIDAMKQARHCLFGYKAGCKMDAEAVQQLIDNLDAAVAREEAQTVEPVYLECVDGYWCSISKKRYDALSEDRRWLLFDQPAPPPSGERAALIECLRFHQSLSTGKNSIYQQAADMLAAGAAQPASAAAAPQPPAPQAQELTQPDLQRMWSDAMSANRQSTTDAAMDFARAVLAAQKANK